MTLVIRHITDYGDRSLSLRVVGCRASWGGAIEARLDVAVDGRRLAARIQAAGLDRQVRIGRLTGMMADVVRVHRDPTVDWEIM